MTNYFIINPGSASKKYALYKDDACTFLAHFEKENDEFVVTFTRGTETEKRAVSRDEYENATAYLIAEMAKRGIASATDIAGIGLRIVAPGSYFLGNKIVDAKFLEKLEETAELAPIHTASAIAEIKNLADVADSIPIVAVSDSAFHATITGAARHYALPSDLAQRYDIIRFGYHGISFRSIADTLAGMQMTNRSVVCHLGSGASIAALQNGMSRDTTMGFTPLEGLAMATRTGDIDAGAAIYIAKKLGFSLDELEAFLNEKCGLLGMTGKTGDIRTLFALEHAGDTQATLALELFVYRIKKYIGAYFAALGGIDALVFSATAGERSSLLRARICDGLDALGIVLDPIKNDSTISRNGFIHDENRSNVHIAVVVTDEMGQMARDVAAIIQK